MERRNQAYGTLEKNYFEPYNETFVSRNNLHRILSGQVKNPHRVKNPDSKTGYSFFVVCNREIGELQETKTRKFGHDLDFDFFYNNNCEWFARFCSVRESRIIVPNRYVLILDIEKEKALVDPSPESSLNSGYLHYDHCINNRVLTTNVSLDALKGMLLETQLKNDLLGTMRETLK